VFLADLKDLAQTLSFVHYCIKQWQNYALEAKEAITKAFKLDVSSKGMTDSKEFKDHVLIPWDFYCRQPRGA
jgi:hypothetical protein